MEIKRPKPKQPIPEHAEKVFSGVLFDVYQWDQELYDGRIVKFEKLKRPDTVVIFGVLPDGKILLTEQEQPGKDPYIGAVGGRVDANENILDAAKRELLEESGYEAKEWFLWDSQQPIGKIEWAVYTFIAKDLNKVADLNLDGGEKITMRPVDFDEFIEIGTREKFTEKEVVFKLLEAKYDSKKREHLKALFNL